MIFEVLGRDNLADESKRLGSIEAESVEQAQSISWHTFDGFKRADLWVVPREAIVEVDASAGAMDEGVLEEDTKTLADDPTDRRDIDA